MSPPSFRRLSAPGAGALSIWRLCADAAELMAVSGLSVLPRPARPVRVRLPDGAGGVLDEGVLVIEPVPLAGVESGRAAEIHLHGGHGVASALRSLLAGRGWREADATPGTDGLRLLEARAPLNARVAAALLEGAFEERLAGWSARPATRPLPPAAARELAWAGVLEAPPAIVLAGPPNAGKSTLFNAWLREERVTVSAHPGTTRDSVEAGILLGRGEDAFEARLVDTAGLWDPADPVDRAAVGAAQESLSGAWRVIWVLDALSAPEAPVARALAQAGGAGLRLVHRCDALPEGPAPGWLDGFKAAVDPVRPDGAAPVWLCGAVQAEGSRLIARLEAALVAALGEPPAALGLPIGAARRETWRRTFG